MEVSDRKQNPPAHLPVATVNQRFQARLHIFQRAVFSSRGCHAACPFCRIPAYSNKHPSSSLRNWIHEPRRLFLTIRRWRFRHDFALRMLKILCLACYSTSRPHNTTSSLRISGCLILSKTAAFRITNPLRLGITISLLRRPPFTTVHRSFPACSRHLFLDPRSARHFFAGFSNWCLAKYPGTDIRTRHCSTDLIRHATARQTSRL